MFIVGNYSTVAIILLAVSLLAALYALFTKNTLLLTFLGVVVTITIAFPELYSKATSDTEGSGNSKSVDIPKESVLHYKGHTYFAYRTSDIDTYWDALEYARSRGGYLAVITDSEENRAVYDYVFDTLKYSSAYFGLTNEGTEGIWHWIDGTEYNYQNWAGGQPDHPETEHYALFWYGDRAYRWNNADFGKDSIGTVTFLIEWDQ